MRVCFVSPGARSLFLPGEEVCHGGAETQLYLISRELARRGDFEVHAIVRGEAGREPVEREGVHVHFVPFGPGLGPKWRLQRTLAGIGPEVCLQRGMSSTTKEVAFYALWRRCRFVYWIAHDYDVDPAIEVPDMRRTRSWRWGVGRADAVIAQTRRQFEAAKVEWRREATVIPNAFPPRQPTQGARVYILWVGRFAPFKRPGLFVDLARLLPERRLLMIAPVPSDGPGVKVYEGLKARVEATENLEHVPGVPLAAIDAYYDTARLLVNTSTHEGFPNTFIQALWAGAPLASLDFDPDGVIAEHGLGVPGAASLEAFAESIEGLLDDRDAWAACQRRGLEYVQAHHDLERNVAQLAALLRGLVG